MLNPKEVHGTLNRYQLVDGYPFVLDLEKSHGCYLHDAATGQEHLDFFTSFSSWPIGYAHPGMEDSDFRRELESAALTKVANSDIYTVPMARFVETFATHVTPEGFPHHFWVSGGALAVENALKVAFDWKAHKVGADRCNNGDDLVVLHFAQAFHGRSGYTMSLTNTDPTKVALFPKFDWPRVSNPAIEFDLDGNIANDVEALEARCGAEMEQAFATYSGRIAAIIIEPLQGEGGDNHFRAEFFARLRSLADEHEALLIYDEVQTGFFGSGKPWLWQYHGVAPDVVSFGKKSQICGIYAGPRVDEVPENVFRRSSRINSTWGGNLVDMVRSRRFIEIILEENLGANIATMGARFVAGLRAVGRERGHFSNVRGVGCLVAFTLESAEQRDELLGTLAQKGLLALSSGEQAVRFRLPLIVGETEIDLALERIADSLPARV
ncbi:MAG TPA: L-lysine 6-transaminase [Planctomycetota bacterium]|jgi:L-lysine 6-transaminase|nr:L-lysine 6-transaminase [Planctomycetota bacterium]